MSRKNICIVATVPFVLLVFMREHVAKLSEDFNVTLVSNGNERELGDMLSENVKFRQLKIERKISLLADFLALFHLIRLFRRQKFDCVHSLMPKSALLAMLAAKLTGIPKRVHIFTGQVWATETGLSRQVLKWMDRLLAACATHLLADSQSQRDFLINERIVKAEKIRVLAKGSISGVDTSRFRFDLCQRSAIRKNFGIADDDVVFLNVARITRAKGVIDLTSAFMGMADRMPHAHLIIIGLDEEELLPTLEQAWIKYRNRIHWIEYTEQPESYMSAADVFCLPSYREGFSLATIQAAGVGLPAIVSRVYGLTDAVQPNVTGIFHEAGAVPEIQEAMKLLYENESLRKTMGEAAQRRAYRDFAQEYVVNEMRLFYKELLGR